MTFRLLNKFIFGLIIIFLMAFADFNAFTLLTKGIFTVLIILSLFIEELGGLKRIEIGFDFLFLFGVLKLNESIEFEYYPVYLLIFFLLILRIIFGIVILIKER